jgi:hypothetical protein
LAVNRNEAPGNFEDEEDTAWFERTNAGILRPISARVRRSETEADRLIIHVQVSYRTLLAAGILVTACFRLTNLLIDQL